MRIVAWLWFAFIATTGAFAYFDVPEWPWLYVTFLVALIALYLLTFAVMFAETGTRPGMIDPP